MAKKAKLHGKTRNDRMQEQLRMPVTFDPAGNLMTLGEVRQRGCGSVPRFESLSPEKQVELTVKRIEAQPAFEVAMVGGGIVGKERAIEEVKAQTDIGKVLTEIEKRTIDYLLEEVPSK
jgi:hypothetical protein